MTLLRVLISVYIASPVKEEFVNTIISQMIIVDTCKIIYMIIKDVTNFGGN